MDKDGERLQITTLEKCQTWLRKCSLDDDDKSISEDSSSVITETTENSAMDSGFVFYNNGITEENAILNVDDSVELQPFANRNSGNQYNCNIYKSRKVHIGDVTNINGPVVVSNIYTGPPTADVRPLMIETGSRFMVVDRINWLAQPPLTRPTMLEKPAQYVVICHTATEEGFSQSENTLLVRLTQTFHIESRKWDDIAYNFLIGSDGNVYEGRGWNAQGAHTYHYNRVSVGIAFVGCFLEHLPPEVSLNRCKNLIKHGVKIGAIAEDYSLVGHCQCKPSASPGYRLYEEIKTWDHWNGDVSVTRPAPEIEELKTN